MKIKFLILFLLIFSSSPTSLSPDALSSLTNRAASKLKYLYTADNTTKQCHGCFILFEAVSTVVNSGYGIAEIAEVVKTICKLAFAPNICNGLIEAYTNPVAVGLFRKLLNPSMFCQTIKMCEGTFTEINQLEYAAELMKSRPTTEIIRSPSKTPVIRIVHVSDIHTDLSYTPGTSAMCDIYQCCRADSGIHPDPRFNAGVWGGNGMCDLPEKTLNRVAEIITEMNPDILIVTGDNPSHDVWNATGNEAYEVAKKFKSFLREQYGFKNSIVNVLGNHEYEPIDTFNPYTRLEKQKEMFKLYADLWRDEMDEVAYSNFLNFGYYAMTFKIGSNDIKVIALNCVLCDALNFNLIGDPTDPMGMFNWLEAELLKAEESKTPVIIANHIPFGDVTSLQECSLRYKILVDRFNDTIVLQLSGHTHYDELKVHHRVFPNKAGEFEQIGAQWIVPSLSTYTKRNSSFREFLLNEDFYPLDYNQFRLDIIKANETPDVKPNYDIVYSATKVGS